MSLFFHSQSLPFNLRQKRRIRKWIEQVAGSEKKIAGDISYIFCTDDELLEINLQHLNHNTYTDIITFDYSDDDLISGDIFISIDRVKENAPKFEATFEDELHRVMIHGILHLCGYKDKTKDQAALMRRKENNALKVLQNLS